MLAAPLLLALALAPPAEAGPGAALWVQADVLNLRAAPNPGAESLARLPYGTWLRVESEKSGWARVVVGDRPREAELVGWVDAAYLGPTLPSRDQLLAAAADADAPADAVRPLTRALALDPGDPDAITLLGTVAAQLGDAALQRKAERLAAGKEPVYLATCMDGRAVLHTAIVPATGAVSVLGVGEVEADGSSAALQALADQLGGVSWYAHGSEASRVAPGRFARPFVGLVHNGGVDPWHAPVVDAELAVPEGVVVLGACSDEGGVYATTPLTRLPEAHVPPTLAGKALAGLAELDDTDSTGLSLASWDGLPFLEVRATVPYVFHDCGGEEIGPEPVHTWWLVDEAGRIVRRWGADLPPETAETLPFSTYGAGWWLAVDLPDTSLMFSVGTGESAMEAGVSVQTFPGGKPGPVAHVTLRSSGC